MCAESGNGASAAQSATFEERLRARFPAQDGHSASLAKGCNFTLVMGMGPFEFSHPTPESLQGKDLAPREEPCYGTRTENFRKSPPTSPTVHTIHSTRERIEAIQLRLYPSGISVRVLCLGRTTLLPVRYRSAPAPWPLRVSPPT